MEVSTNDKVLDQLTRILSSSQLSGSSVLSEFLTFIVHETLQGRGSELKEYTIGVHALRKDNDFNPQLDSIVRIHAGRLRRALKEYYYEEGAGDPIIIGIPKGSYVPVFENRPVESVLFIDQKESDAEPNTLKRETPKAPYLAFNAHVATRRRPSVAVLPYKKIGGDESLENFGKSMGEFLSTELTQFDNLKVISYFSTEYVASLSVGLDKISSILEAEYILTGSVHDLQGIIRVCVQLNSSDSRDQLWAQTFEKRNTTESHIRFQTHVVESVLAAVAGFNGVISRHEIKKNTHLPDGLTGVSTLAYWYNRHIDSFDTQTTREALKFYENVIQEDPENSLAMSYLSTILSSEMTLPSYQNKKENLAHYYAQSALKLDPYNQQAYLALALNLLIKRKTDECLRTLEQGLEINPRSIEYRGSMAALMIYAGEFEAGVKILDRVVKLNPYLPWWQTMSYSYYAYYREFYADALFWADRIKVNVVWPSIIKAASFAQLDQMDKAHELISEFNHQFPDVRLLEPTTLRSFFYSDLFIDKLENGLARLAV